MSQNMSERIRDYFKELFKDAHTGVLLVHNAYEACQEVLQEERLAAYILLQYPDVGIISKDYLTLVNVFQTRFKSLSISTDVTQDILDVALRHFKDPKSNPDIAPLIGELRLYVKTSMEVDKLLKDMAKLPAPHHSIANLWERLVMMNYTNKYLQTQHEELLGVVSSQMHSPPSSPTNCGAPAATLNPSITTLQQTPQESVRPAATTLPLPGEGMPHVVDTVTVSPTTVIAGPLTLPLPGEGLVPQKRMILPSSDMVTLD